MADKSSPTKKIFGTYIKLNLKLYSFKFPMREITATDSRRKFACVTTPVINGSSFFFETSPAIMKLGIKTGS